ncbi:glycosyltransferase [Actinoplanes sp. NPDC026619]|uniref:glycosyltransferase family 2 protein n=1 Tax=Actinoplanes sp. NPDC026619 TaxID=3155798 RepID=UPI0033CF78B8
MATVSIITAAHAPSAGFIRETISSVEAQILPTGWEIEWLVQEDGNKPTLASLFDDVARVRYSANGKQLGVGPTRNLALERASGSLVRVLDADDLLLPNAVASLIPHFVNQPIHWGISQADDLMTDGSRVAWDPLIPVGLVKAGVINDYAIAHGANWPIHGAGLMLRTDTVRAFGGWAASPNDEDTIMFCGLGEVCDGYNDPEVTWLYRQHPGQVTRTAEWKKQSDAARHTALQRVQAIRALRLTLNAAQLPSLEVGGGESLWVDRPMKERGEKDYL